MEKALFVGPAKVQLSNIMQLQQNKHLATSVPYLIPFCILPLNTTFVNAALIWESKKIHQSQIIYSLPHNQVFLVIAIEICTVVKKYLEANMQVVTLQIPL